MAIASLVLGILGLVCTPLCAPLGLIGLVLGIIGTVRASQSPQRFGGRGLAIAGICTGGASLLVAPLAVALLLPSFANWSEGLSRTIATSNLVAVERVLKSYAGDNAGQFPPDLSVLIDTGAIEAGFLQDPSEGSFTNACDFYYVTGLTTTDPGEWIIAFGDASNHGGEGASIVYLNGVVNFVKEPEFSQEIERFQRAYEAKRGTRPAIRNPR
jgi:hypothetical protein